MTKVDLPWEFVFTFENVGACPLCGNPDSELERTKPGIVTKDSEYELFYRKCQSCEHIYMDPRPDDKTIDVLYTTGSYRGLLGNMQPDLADFTTETWRGLRISSLLLGMEKEGAIVIDNAIDIGGSTGALLFILARGLWGEGHKITKLLNVELNTRFSAWGRQKGIMDIRTMEQAKPYLPFDLVTCVHVLEHTNQPREFLREVISMGKTGSTYYIEVPSIRKGAFGIFHPQVFSSEHLIALCQELGLEILRSGHIRVEGDEPKEHMVVARKP